MEDNADAEFDTSAQVGNNAPSSRISYRDFDVNRLSLQEPSSLQNILRNPSLLPQSRSRSRSRSQSSPEIRSFALFPENYRPSGYVNIGTRTNVQLVLGQMPEENPVSDQAQFEDVPNDQSPIMVVEDAHTITPNDN